MTGPRRRRGVGARVGSGEVVSITARSAYRPDYKRVACGQVLAAREKLGMDHDEFAGYLGDLLGWTVTGEAAELWEQGSTPPSDVLVACAVIVHQAPGEVLAFPQSATAGETAALLAAEMPGATLLGSVPESFPASQLSGPWVTCYQFGHAGELRHHADIAQITAGSDRSIRAGNHPPEPRSEGRAKPFRNMIEAELAGRHLIGHWRNTSDTRYFGSLHLAVLPGEMVMEGYYTGVGSDIQVSTGYWKWVRLEPGSLVEADLAAVALREPAALYDIVMHSQYDAPLTLADVREDA
jgi:DNA-binding transcriptional regulator YiaG